MRMRHYDEDRDGAPYSRLCNYRGSGTAISGSELFPLPCMLTTVRNPNGFLITITFLHSLFSTGQLQPADVAADQIGEVFMAEAQRRQTAKAKL